LWSCKKNYTGSTEADVYIAGSIYRGASPTATCWKNSIAVHFTDGIEADYGTNQSRINTMFISGGGLYLGGVIITPLSRIPTYWKNGKAVSLYDGTDGSADAIATCIRVVDNDVYVAFFEGTPFYPYIAKLWKNGTIVSLSDSTVSAAINAMEILKK
jgi:hypothetical protein